MNKTKIEWTDYTWNPITGCLNGCSYCYARKIAERFRGSKAFPNGFEPTFHIERLNEPLKLKRPSKIFVASMSELFYTPFRQTDSRQWVEGDTVKALIFDVIRECPQHTFQLLTKQPQNLAKWSPFPDNCWVGVSATKTIEYLNALDRLRNIKARVKFVSIEPLLDWDGPLAKGISCYQDKPHWVIIGAQTNPYKPPRIEWVREITEACDKAGIPVFLKDNLKPLGLEMRQEFPSGH